MKVNKAHVARSTLPSFESARSCIAGALFSALLFGVGGLTTVSAGTQTAIIKGTDGAPYGYQQFLPSGFSSSTQKLPLVVFFHGKGEGGDGDKELGRVERHGPPMILKNGNSGVLYDRFDKTPGQTYGGAIVLSPQFPMGTDGPDGSKWTGAGIKEFFYYLFTQSRISPRIDMSRIYLVGLSNGAHGIYDYMNTQEQANRKTALLIAAPRGVLDVNGMAAAAYTPFWALTAYGDSSTSASASADRISHYINGNGGGVMEKRPNGFFLTGADGKFLLDSNGKRIPPSYTMTALYSPATRWEWIKNANADGSENTQVYSTAHHPKLTLYPGNAHDTWTMTFNNIKVWDWLFAQKKVVTDTVKPTLTITHPTSASTYTTTSSSIGIAGTATDNIAMHKVTYHNAADGQYGVMSGSTNWSKTLPLNLVIGVNRVTITARDTSGNAFSKTITITRQ